MDYNEVRPPVVVYIVMYHVAKNKIWYMLTQYVWGFTGCSLKTSRIVRVGTRNCTIRIAAVSQEHALVSTTRKVTRPENDTVLVLALKFTWVLCGWSK